MYLKSNGGYYIGTEQHARKAPFLILAAGESNRPLFACVRKVALSQFGHFMMGTARIGGQSICLSGSYGSDGLPINFDKLTERAKREFVRVPDAITEVYWKGNGWNGAGAEAPTVRRWALEAFKDKL